MTIGDRGPRRVGGMSVGRPECRPSEADTLRATWMPVRAVHASAAVNCGIAVATRSPHVEASWIDRDRQAPWFRNSWFHRDLFAAHATELTRASGLRTRSRGTLSALYSRVQAMVLVGVIVLSVVIALAAGCGLIAVVIRLMRVPPARSMHRPMSDATRLSAPAIPDARAGAGRRSDDIRRAA